MSDSGNAASDFLAALGNTIGTPDLEWNEENVCRLILDDRLVIDLEKAPDSNMVQIYAVVGVDPGDNATVLRHLLSANLFGQGTSGAVLGLDEDRGEILLTQKVDTALLSAEEAVTRLEAFVNYAEAWTHELLDLAGSAEGEDSSAEEPAPDFLRV